MSIPTVLLDLGGTLLPMDQKEFKRGYFELLAEKCLPVESRIRWAGLDVSDFECITTYENSRYCKPNPEYYNEILYKMNLQSKECLMVRNDVAEDMTARAVGINVFLLTDCLINKEHEDINQYPRGSYEQLLNYIENLK